MLDTAGQQELAFDLKGSETVLVVDDLESVRSLLKDVLSLFGYTVICAEDGIDGLNKFREYKDRIHVVLLDIMMPRLNGVDLFREIKRLESNAKVLFMTGYNELLDKSDLQDNIKCIIKPFGIRTLLKEMREVLNSPS